MPSSSSWPSRSWRARTRRASLTSPRRSRPSRAAPKLAIWFTFGDARPLLEQGAADLPVEGIGIDFYATHLADVPDGFPKLLLAGVVDARNSLLEEPRELASFAQRLGERVERIALVPNGDLQYVSERIAGEKLARLGKARTATTEAAA